MARRSNKKQTVKVEDVEVIDNSAPTPVPINVEATVTLVYEEVKPEPSTSYTCPTCYAVHTSNKCPNCGQPRGE